MSDIKVADVGKAIEILWGSYQTFLTNTKSKDTASFEGFVQWIRSFSGYQGWPLEQDIEAVRLDEGSES